MKSFLLQLCAINRALLYKTAPGISRRLTSVAQSTMSGEFVKFPSENASSDAEGVIFGDESKTTKGLILVHEWWGKNEQILKQGAEMASSGNLIVLVMDMYRGKVATDKETAGHLMGELNWDGAVQDLAAGAQYLKKRGCTGVGVSGMCMGGALSFAGAAKVSEIDAAAPFYGIPDQTKFDLTKITIPVQGHFGVKDEIVGFSSKKDYDALNEKLKAAGVNFELFEYDAGHAFVNPENKVGPNYNQELANLAFGRVYEFMQKNLP